MYLDWLIKLFCTALMFGTATGAGLTASRVGATGRTRNLNLVVGVALLLICAPLTRVLSDHTAVAKETQTWDATVLLSTIVAGAVLLHRYRQRRRTHFHV